MTEPSNVPGDSKKTLLTIALVNVRAKRDISNYVTWADENDVDLFGINEARPDMTFEQEREVFTAVTKHTGFAWVKVNQSLNLKCSYVNTHVVALKIKKPNLILYGWYITPSEEMIDENEEHPVQRLCRLLGKKESKTIHTGDLNARSSLLGDCPNRRGEQIETAASAGNFIRINDTGAKTWRRGDTRSHSSSIDWTFITEDLVGRVEWINLPALFESDHTTILIRVRGKIQVETPYQKQKVAPLTFVKEITRTTKQTPPEEWFLHYTEAVQKAKKYSAERKAKQLPEHLQFIKEQINSLTKKLTRSKGTGAQLRASLRELTSTFKKQKAEHDAAQRREAMVNPTSKQLYKQLKQDTRDTAKLTHVLHDERILTGNEACQILLQKFFPDDLEEDSLKLPSELPPNDAPLTKEEVKWALDTFAPNSAPGKSGVSIALLRKWYQSDPEYLTGLMSSWYREAIFPEQLKESIIIALVKNKRMKWTRDNSRPISLTETLGRWYEKIVDNRLMHHIESNKLIEPAQFGFRDSCSGEQALALLQSIRQKNQEKFEMLIRADVKSAFDSVKHSSIVQTLIEFQVPGNLIKIILDFLRERRASMNLGEDWITAMVKRGVPQGSCLGPHLYIITTNLMIQTLSRAVAASTSTRTEVIAFADDVLIVSASKKPNWVKKKAGQLMDTMKTELAKAGLELAEEKTEVMVTMESDRQSIDFGGRTWNVTPIIKFLGVEFSANRNFHQHVDSLLAKVDSWFKAHHELFSRVGGLSYRDRKKLVSTVLLPKILYGAQAWATSLTHDDKQIIDQMWRKIAQAITISPTQAGTLAASTLAQMLPLYLQIKKKLLVSEHLRSGHFEGQAIEQKASKFDAGHPASWTYVDYGCGLSTNEEVNALEAEHFLFTDGSQYTEDSCTHTGSAVVHKKRNKSSNEMDHIDTIILKLGPWNSVFQAELMAIRTACHLILELEPGSTAAILSDSLSSLQAIGSFNPNSKIAIEIKNILKAIELKGITLTLHHVRAHAGIDGNEECDMAAKAAARYGTVVELPVPISSVKRKITSQLYDEYQNWFDTAKRGRTIRKFFDGPSDPLLRKARINWCTSELYTGHGLNLSSMKYGYQGSTNKCECGESQTVVHILTTCKLHVASNIKAAAKAGIPQQDFLLPWATLRKNPRFHDYVHIRSKELRDELKRENAHELDMVSVCRGIRTLDAGGWTECAPGRLVKRLQGHLYSDQNNWSWTLIDDGIEAVEDSGDEVETESELEQLK